MKICEYGSSMNNVTFLTDYNDLIKIDFCLRGDYRIASADDTAVEIIQ